MKKAITAPGVRAAMAAALLFVAACGGSQETDANDAGAGAAAAAGAATAFVPEPVALAERDVEGFLAAMREFKRLGLAYDKKVGDDPGASVSNMATAWAANREALDILQRNDFDIPRFQRVTYSIMLAAAAAEMEGNESKMKEGQEQLEAMKGKVPPEMYEQMKKATEQAAQITTSMMSQPQGNIDLVRRYRAEIEAINR